MKLSDASMVVVEQTEKVCNTFVIPFQTKPTKNICHCFISNANIQVAQAITLFIQGLGYSLRRPAAASC